MPKIYVTMETAHDFGPAEQYGEVIFITNDDMNNTRGSLHNEALLRQIRMAMHKFNPDEDFIIISGSPYVAALVFMILGHKNHRRVRFLRWSNRDWVYTPVTIDFNVGFIDEESQNGERTR